MIHVICSPNCSLNCSLNLSDLVVCSRSCLAPDLVCGAVLPRSCSTQDGGEPTQPASCVGEQPACDEGGLGGVDATLQCRAVARVPVTRAQSMPRLGTGGWLNLAHTHTQLCGHVSELSAQQEVRLRSVIDTALFSRKESQVCNTVGLSSGLLCRGHESFSANTWAWQVLTGSITHPLQIILWLQRVSL